MRILQDERGQNRRHYKLKLSVSRALVVAEYPVATIIYIERKIPSTHKFHP